MLRYGILDLRLRFIVSRYSALCRFDSKEKKLTETEDVMCKRSTQALEYVYCLLWRPKSKMALEPKCSAVGFFGARCLRGSGYACDVFTSPYVLRENHPARGTKR